MRKSTLASKGSDLAQDTTVLCAEGGRKKIHNLYHFQLPETNCGFGCGWLSPQANWSQIWLFQSQETDGTRDVEPSGVEAKVFPRSLASTNRPQDVLNLDSKYSCLRRSFSDMNMILAWKRVMLGNKMRRNINQFETSLWFASLGLCDFKLLTSEFQDSLLV